MTATDSIPRDLPGYDNSRWVDLAGVRTHVQHWGPEDADRVVVGLHHFHGSAHTYQRMGRILADRGLRVVAFDRVGFGLTARPHPRGRWTGPDAPYTRGFAVRQLLALLDHLEAPDAVLTGTSMGGTTALEFALAHPDRVRHVVACAAPLTGDASAPARLRPLLRSRLVQSLGAAAVRRLAGRIDRDRLARSWHDPSTIDDADVAAHSRFREVVDWDRGLWWKFVADQPPDLARQLPRLAQLGVPITAVGATHDRLVRPSVAAHVASRCGGRHVELGCGHLVHVEGAALLADLVEEAAR